MPTARVLNTINARPKEAVAMYKTTAEAVAHLGVSIRTLDRWQKAGVLAPIYMNGHLKRFRLADLEAIASNAPSVPRRSTFGNAIAAKRSPCINRNPGPRRSAADRIGSRRAC